MTLSSSHDFFPIWDFQLFLLFSVLLSLLQHSCWLLVFQRADHQKLKSCINQPQEGSLFPDLWNFSSNIPPLNLFDPCLMSPACVCVCVGACMCVCQVSLWMLYAVCLIDICVCVCVWGVIQTLNVYRCLIAFYFWLCEWIDSSDPLHIHHPHLYSI